MRSAILLALATVVPLAGHVLAATTAAYQGVDTTCPIYGPTNDVTGPIEQAVVHCTLTHEGVVRVVACDAGGCTVSATGSLVGTWDPPGYGYAQSGLANFQDPDDPVGAGICSDNPGTVPNGHVECQGTSDALRFAVGAGGCANVFLSSSVVMDYVTTGPEPVPYMAVYLATFIGHEFQLCRDGAGNPSIVLAT